MSSVWSGSSRVKPSLPIVQSVEQFQSAYHLFSSQNGVSFPSEFPSDFPGLDSSEQSPSHGSDQTDHSDQCVTIDTLAAHGDAVLVQLKSWKPFKKSFELDEIPEELRQFLPQTVNNKSHDDYIQIIKSLDKFVDTDIVKVLPSLQITPFPVQFLTLCLEIRRQCKIYSDEYFKLYPEMESVPLKVDVSSSVGPPRVISVAYGSGSGDGSHKSLTSDERFVHIPDIYEEWSDMGFDWYTLHAVFNETPRIRGWIINIPESNYKSASCNKSTASCFGIKCTFLSKSEAIVSHNIGAENFKYMAWIAKALCANMCDYGKKCTKTKECGRVHHEDLKEATRECVRAALFRCCDKTSRFREWVQEFLEAYKPQKVLGSVCVPAPTYNRRVKEETLSGRFDALALYQSPVSSRHSSRHSPVSSHQDDPWGE